jgi:cyclophilin family peptidyl-prolyl cis-trans isomerase
MSKRKLQGRPPSAVETDVHSSPEVESRPWLALLLVAVLLGAVAAAGWGIGLATTPKLPKSLARCHTSTELAPRVFTGPQPICIDPARTYSATIQTTKGSISIVMRAGAAPETVNNFVVLALDGYFNGLRFWRVQDWVVQSGDPLDNGRGGPGYDLPEEPTIEAWGPGAVGMARVPGGRVNGSQFFITKAKWPAPGPDAQYNRFGTVTSGLEIAPDLTTSDRIINIEIKVV